MNMRPIFFLFSLFTFGYVGAQDQEVDLTIETVHALVDAPPEYPGGLGALRMFLLENMRFPVDVTDHERSGSVKVRFVVDRNGKVREPRVVLSHSEAVDGEALRIVGLLPEWKPGCLRGKAVNVMYVLPITFNG